MRKPAILPAAILLLPFLGAAFAGAGPRSKSEAEVPLVAAVVAEPVILLAQDGAEQCKQACRAKYKCNEIIGTPGLRNQKLISCKQNLQACIKGCN